KPKSQVELKPTRSSARIQNIKVVGANKGNKVINGIDNINIKDMGSNFNQDSSENESGDMEVLDNNNTGTENSNDDSVGLILARSDREITVFGPKGVPITVPEPYETYKRPIGGLSFKDEIPELAQADTSKEGDTIEPSLIVPSTSGRDGTAGVVLAWHNNWVLVARSDDCVVIKRISNILYKKVLEAAKYLSFDELPEAHKVTLYEYESYRVELAKYIDCIREKYSIVHNPKRSAFKEHEPIGRVVNGSQTFWSLKGIYRLSVYCKEYRQYLENSRKRKLELAHEKYFEESQRNKQKFKGMRHTPNDFKVVEPTAFDLLTEITNESESKSTTSNNKQILKQILWSKHDLNFEALQPLIYNKKREEKDGQIFFNDNIEQINLDKSNFISECLKKN
ncbi:13097_t:CDS:2, partial [Entrophospora sp. SA101]